MYFNKFGICFVNYFGIGQVLELKFGCIYYLDCLGIVVQLSIKNDFINGMDLVEYLYFNFYIILFMIFFDLVYFEDIVKIIQFYDKEFFGMFKWVGEFNVMK